MEYMVVLLVCEAFWGVGRSNEKKLPEVVLREHHTVPLMGFPGMQSKLGSRGDPNNSTKAVLDKLTTEQPPTGYRWASKAAYLGKRI